MSTGPDVMPRTWIPNRGTHDGFLWQVITMPTNECSTPMCLQRVVEMWISDSPQLICGSFPDQGRSWEYWGVVVEENDWTRRKIKLKDLAVVKMEVKCSSETLVPSASPHVVATRTATIHKNNVSTKELSSRQHWWLDIGRSQVRISYSDSYFPWFPSFPPDKYAALSRNKLQLLPSKFAIVTNSVCIHYAVERASLRVKMSLSLHTATWLRMWEWRFCCVRS